MCYTHSLFPLVLICLSFDMTFYGMVLYCVVLCAVHHHMLTLLCLYSCSSKLCMIIKNIYTGKIAIYFCDHPLLCTIYYIIKEEYICYKKWYLYFSCFGENDRFCERYLDAIVEVNLLLIFVNKLSVNSWFYSLVLQEKARQWQVIIYLVQHNIYIFLLWTLISHFVL